MQESPYWARVRLTYRQDFEFIIWPALTLQASSYALHRANRVKFLNLHGWLRLQIVHFKIWLQRLVKHWCRLVWWWSLLFCCESLFSCVVVPKSLSRDGKLGSKRMLWGCTSLQWHLPIYLLYILVVCSLVCL